MVPLSQYLGHQPMAEGEEGHRDADIYVNSN